jgi:Transposase
MLDVREGQPAGDCARARGHRRLSPDRVTELVAQCRAGWSVRQLAEIFRINRTTVLAHLERAGVARRANVRKLSDEQVHEAATRYASGLSLKTVAKAFSVNEATLSTEFRKAGTPIRARRGWPPSG